MSFEVITGLCLHRTDCDEWIGAIEVSLVRFKPLSDTERTLYLDSGQWEGKSGAYGVQDHDPFVSVIQGSFSNVVGLPMERLELLLQSYPELSESLIGEPVKSPASLSRSGADA